MLTRYRLYLRLVLLIVFIVFVVGWATDQYILVQNMVRFICIDCLGLNG